LNTGLALRIASRELRAGARGFLVFLACLTLGVSAIAAAGSASSMFRQGVSGELSRILGGDISFSANRAEIPDELTAELETLGTISHIADVNVMAAAGDTRRLVRVRGVDTAYPLLGEAVTQPVIDLTAAFEVRDNLPGAIAGQDIFNLFDLQVGDELRIGDQVFQLRGVLESEPDRLDLGFDFAPRVLTSLDAVQNAQFLIEGSIFSRGVRVVFDDLETDLSLASDDYQARYEEAGVRITTRDDLGDQFDDLLDQLSVFLAVAGLAALLAGGLGVAQAVATFLSTRTGSIAALKALGADGGTIRLAYILQILTLAIIGSAMGALIGGAVPNLLVAVYGDALPIPANNGFYLQPMLMAGLFGVLSAMMFALPAIGRARATPPAALLGGESRSKDTTPWPERIGALVLGITFVGLAVLFSPSPMVAGVLLGFAVIVFLILWAAAFGLRRLARFLARFTRGGLRIALTQLGGPGSVAPVAAPALGLGLALLAVVTLVQHNLVTQIRDTAPANLPGMAFAMVPGDRAEDFDRIARAAGADITDRDRYLRAPSLRGRITRLKGEPIDRDEVADSEQWIVSGETGLTYLANLPDGSEIEEGEWWPQDYAGPPLISVEGDAARGLGVKVGDTMTVRILGREFTAEIANLRTIDWGGFGINRPLVFAPGTLEAANSPHTALLRTDPEDEEAVARAVGDNFPTVVIYRVRERLQAAAEVFEQTTAAINAIAGVVALAGALVMLGAFAAAAQRRVTDAALLKTFGVTPAGVLAIFALEFALVGAMAAGLAVALAAPPAWFIMTNMVEAVWAPDWNAVGWVSGIAILAAAAGGGLVARAALAVPSARALRSV
jgi:putative ABC transport system permease protein